MRHRPLDLLADQMLAEGRERVLRPAGECQERRVDRLESDRVADRCATRARRRSRPRSRSSPRPRRPPASAASASANPARRPARTRRRSRGRTSSGASPVSGSPKAMNPSEQGYVSWSRISGLPRTSSNEPRYGSNLTPPWTTTSRPGQTSAMVDLPASSSTRPKSASSQLGTPPTRRDRLADRPLGQEVELLVPIGLERQTERREGIGAEQVARLLRGDPAQVALADALRRAIRGRSTRPGRRSCPGTASTSAGP